MANPTTDAPHSFRRILVPTDFGEPSARALSMACDLAAKYGAVVTLLHAYEMPPVAYAGALGPAVDFLAPVRAAAEKHLAEELSLLRERLPSATSVLAFGAPWEEILKATTDTHSDLVVMGTHGRRGVSHALIGSVAEKVVRASAVPVLTVH
jgi:nucleotide-binding universal stress UspA family protein